MIAELLASESEKARPPLQKALRRAARRAFLWPEEAAEIVRQKRSLTELPGVGPTLEKYILRWIDDPPELPPPPPIRDGFLTLPQARRALQKKPHWLGEIKGDLQMHSEWSDGTGSLQEMAEAGIGRGYEYISITDHSKGLKIAGGIDENELRRQAEEIGEINDSLREAGKNFQVLRSVELNLNPRGEGDMEARSLAELELVLGCFHSSLRKKEDQTDRYLAGLGNLDIQ